MRTSTILILIIYFSTIGTGQEHQITLLLENAVGLEDSIVVGYDEAASYGIDSQFGEIDILNVPFTKEFEARTAIYDYEEVRDQDARIIESKKMILGKICEDPNYFNEANSIMLVIKNDDWPLTITWNNEKIEDECEDTYIVNCTPGGWFHICDGRGAPILTSMRDSIRLIVRETDYKIELENGDTLRALFVSYNKEIIINDNTDILENEVYNLFPNPTKDMILLEGIGLAKDRIEIIDGRGVVKLSMEVSEQIGVEYLVSGTYFYQIKRGEKILQSGKFIKW